MKNLLLDPKVREEIEAIFSPKIISSDSFGDPEGFETALSFVEWAAVQPLDCLARHIFIANCRAKQDNYGWYEVKDVLIRTFIVRASRASPENEGIISWGLGADGCEGDVLYIDLAGYGQISFHIFLDGEDMKGVPNYPFGWTEIRNDLDIFFQQVGVEEALAELKSFRNGESQFAKGDIHNLLVRAGMSPV